MKSEGDKMKLISKIMGFWDLTGFICSKVGDSYLVVKKASINKLDPWIQIGDWLYPVNLLNPTVELPGMRWFFIDSETVQTLPLVEIKEKLLSKSMLDEILHTKTARNLTIQTENPLQASRWTQIIDFIFGILIGAISLYFLVHGGYL